MVIKTNIMEANYTYETKKKREQHQIEIRRAKNNEIFETRRKKLIFNDLMNMKNFDPDTYFIEANKFMEIAIRDKDTKNIGNILLKVKAALSRSTNPEEIAFKQYFDTSLYSHMIEIRKHYYFGELEILKLMSG